MKLIKLGHLNWWQKTKMISALYGLIVVGVLAGMSIAVSSSSSVMALAKIQSVTLWILPGMTIVTITLLIRINKRLTLRGSRTLRSPK